jgi:chemotaxis signal transduction protein
MSTLVCFRTGDGNFALPVEVTVAVRTATGLVPLPGSRPDVAGVLPGDPPLTVLTTFGRGSDRVLVIRSGQDEYGLLVEEVTGLREVTPDEIGPAPVGQDHGLVTGVVQRDGGLVLLADPVALAGRL